MGEKKLKGRVLQTYFKYIKKKWGGDGLNDCLKACKIDDVNSIVEDKWYAYQIGLDLTLWVGETHGYKACEQLGFAIATERGVVSYVAWMAGMNKILDKYENMFRDSVNYGKVEMDRKENAVTIKYYDIISTEAGCHVYKGTFEGLLSLGKVKNPQVEVTSHGHDGEGCCTFELTWD